MRIGILTFDYCNNYGAVLQAYALKTYLVSLGHSVSFGDYWLPILYHRYDLFPIHTKKKGLTNRLKYYVRCILKYRSWREKRNRFTIFREKHMPVIPLRDEEVDLWMVGSDQVWNPKITKSYDDVYYAKSNLKKPYVFYAVSCPSPLLNEKALHHIKEKNFPVGVREIMMIEKLHSLGIHSELVLDPTLLLSKTEWNNLELPINIQEKYIFSYNLSGIKTLPSIAKMIAVKNGWLDLNPYSPLRTAGPVEFLSYFKFAEMILVSSFHGTVFSIIFHRPFLFFPNHDERDERVVSLLTYLNLTHCIYNSDDTHLQKPQINWDEVEKKLEMLREKSIRFIKTAISRYYEDSQKDSEEG